MQNVIDHAQLKHTKLYLYHIPQFSGVPYTIEIVEQLARKNPQVLKGVKDSSGDLSYSKELAKRLPDIDVFPSSEGTLASAKENHWAGCISATTNVNGAIAQQAWQGRGTEQGNQAAQKALQIRETLSKFPLVPAVKWAVSVIHKDPFWKRLQPPLVSLRPLQANVSPWMMPGSQRSRCSGVPPR